MGVFFHILETERLIKNQLNIKIITSCSSTCKSLLLFHYMWLECVFRFSLCQVAHVWRKYCAINGDIEANIVYVFWATVAINHGYVEEVKGAVCKCVCVRAGTAVLDLRTLIVILVLIEWLQTKPCRPHWLHKPGIMVSLWGGKVIPGLEEYQTLSNGLWEGVALTSVSKLAAEIKLPAALAKRCKTEVLLRVPDSCLRVRVDLAPP